MTVIPYTCVMFHPCNISYALFPLAQLIQRPRCTALRTTFTIAYISGLAVCMLLIYVVVKRVGRCQVGHAIKTSGRDANRVKVKFHYAVEVADLRVQVVCVTQAGRKLVESQLRTGLRPGSNYLDNLGSS